MLCTEIVSDIQNNFCTEHVLPCSAKRRASDKDLPVSVLMILYNFFNEAVFLLDWEKSLNLTQLTKIIEIVGTLSISLLFSQIYSLEIAFSIKTTGHRPLFYLLLSRAQTLSLLSRKLQRKKIVAAHSCTQPKNYETKKAFLCRPHCNNLQSRKTANIFFLRAGLHIMLCGINVAKCK